MIHLLFLALLPIQAFAQSVTYTWPGPEISPNTFPKASHYSFMGRLAQWHGVETCVLTNGQGREFSSENWPTMGGFAQLRLAVLAFDEMQLDSISITHRSGIGGPEKMRVTVVDGDNEWTVLSDAPIAREYATLKLPHTARLRPRNGMEYEQFLILIEPYGGDGGSWDLRSVHIAGSPIEPIAGSPAKRSDERLVNAGKR